MRAFVYTGGAVFPEGITERPQDGDLVIAADSGYLNARKLGVNPSVLLGNFDSLGEPSAPLEVEILRVLAESSISSLIRRPLKLCLKLRIRNFFDSNCQVKCNNFLKWLPDFADTSLALDIMQFKVSFSLDFFCRTHVKILSKHQKSIK